MDNLHAHLRAARRRDTAAARTLDARRSAEKHFSTACQLLPQSHLVITTSCVSSHEQLDPRERSLTMHLHLAVVGALAGCGLSQAYSHPERRNTSYTAVPQLPRNSSSALKPLYEPYSNKTPVFQNDALLQKLSRKLGAISGPLNSPASPFIKRQSDTLPESTCAPGTPCSNGACCSNTGVCSYAPTSCGSNVCISNCDTKAPCGQYADPADATFPLNVCCSQFGFCESIHHRISWMDEPNSCPPIFTTRTDSCKAAPGMTFAAMDARRATESAVRRRRPRAPAAPSRPRRDASATMKAGAQRGRATPSRPRTSSSRA